MRIAIIGAGNVGKTLGTRWAALGHDVIYGVRQPEKPRDGILPESLYPLSQAVSLSEIVVLATPWSETQSVLEACGDLKGKIVVDATNPIAPDFSGLTVGHTNSAGEYVAKWAVGARVVKAFNTIGYNVMANPVFDDRSATLLYCGDDASAKTSVHELAEELGFAPVDAGPLEMARYLEPVAWVWIRLAVHGGHGREIAFELMKR